MVLLFFTFNNRSNSRSGPLCICKKSHWCIVINPYLSFIVIHTQICVSVFYQARRSHWQGSCNISGSVCHQPIHQHFSLSSLCLHLPSDSPSIHPFISCCLPIFLCPSFAASRGHLWICPELWVNSFKL